MFPTRSWCTGNVLFDQGMAARQDVPRAPPAVEFAGEISPVCLAKLVQAALDPTDNGLFAGLRKRGEFFDANHFRLQVELWRAFHRDSAFSCSTLSHDKVEV
jgi:hypothetical protein